MRKVSGRCFPMFLSHTRAVGYLQIGKTIDIHFCKSHISSLWLPFKIRVPMYIKFLLRFCKNRAKMFHARSQRSEGVRSSYLDHNPTLLCSLKKSKKNGHPTSVPPLPGWRGDLKISKKNKNFYFVLFF